jgi:hypothetical protein
VKERLLRLLLVFLLCLGASTAIAHTPSETHSNWAIDGAHVRVDFTVAAVEAQRLTEDGAVPSLERLTQYLKSRLLVSSAGGNCAAAAPPRALAAVAGFQRLEFQYRCTDVNGITLHSDAFFELVPTHMTFAQVQDNHGNFFEQVMTADRRTIEVSGDAGADRLESAGFLDYMRMGVMHIFTGIDHMSFLLGLVLISRKLKDLLFVVTGFTIGHSLTLALAVTGIIRPHAEYIDALVALTIALIGVENIAIAARRSGTIALTLFTTLIAMAGLRLAGIGTLPVALLIGAAIFTSCYILIAGHVQDARRWRMLVTLVFGLIHGFGFAADLLESRIPTAKLVELLVGFNLGVEVGQIAVVCAVALCGLLLSRSRVALSRAMTVDLLGSGLIGLGTCWLIGRSF